MRNPTHILTLWFGAALAQSGSPLISKGSYHSVFPEEQGKPVTVDSFPDAQASGDQYGILKSIFSKP